MKKQLLLIALAVAFTAGQAMATIIGSPHDFSSQTAWNTRAGVCSPCHTAHNTDPAQLVPLWAHATTVATFTPYASPSLNATSTGPSGQSKACLSCHDGTVAINTSIDGTIPGDHVAVYATGIIGTDLHVTHPISITYDSALATADGFLYDPSTPLTWTPGVGLVGKTISQALLKGTNHDKVECSSCHDPHKQVGSSTTSGIMARISGADTNGRGSLLCRSCHNK